MRTRAQSTLCARLHVCVCVFVNISQSVINIPSTLHAPPLPQYTAITDAVCEYLCNSRPIAIAIICLQLQFVAIAFSYALTVVVNFYCYCYLTFFAFCCYCCY